MSSEWRKIACWQQGQPLHNSAIIVLLAALMSGCSTDIVRLNTPLLGFESSQTERPSQSIHSDGSLFEQSPNPGVKSYAQPAATFAPVQQSEMAQVAPTSDGVYRSAAAAYQATTNDGLRNDNFSDSANATSPTKITVRSGDTLYTLARRHNVSVASIENINGLTSNVIRPGQVLYLSPSSIAPQNQPSAPPRQTMSQTNEGETHIVKPGETLYSISKRHRVDIQVLKTLNNIDNPRLLRPGQVLQLTAHTTTQEFPTTPKDHGASVSNSDDNSILLNPQPQDKQHIIKSSPPPSQSANGDGAEAANFRWPVVGRIIRGFGKRADGTNNDGINIVVPMGTDIKASEKGTIAYAGNELQGYGNLVLIRHANEYVSVYAHVDRILVRRGDEVRRGQIIAKSGKTGSVQRPQLHFELRQGAKPVDPTPYLSRM